jgi:hypothetical protein
MAIYDNLGFRLKKANQLMLKSPAEEAEEAPSTYFVRQGHYQAIKVVILSNCKIGAGCRG